MISLSWGRTAHAVSRWFITALHVQLFLTLFSLPILIAWGLPVSLLSPLGNLIFTPFLSMFLCISSLLFFSELIALPHAPLDWLLNQITAWWTYFMSYGSTRWIVALPTLPPFVLAVCIIAPLIIVTLPFFHDVGKRCCLYLCVLTALYAYGTYHQHTTDCCIEIPCHTGSLYLIQSQGHTALIDPGCWGSRPSASSWTRFTLLSQLVSRGIPTIDHLIMLQPSGFAFDAAQQLCSLLNMRALYVVVWQGELKKSIAKRYCTLKESFVKEGKKITRLSINPVTIPMSATSHITLTPCQETGTAGEATFPLYAAQVRIDNKDITIYHAKCRCSKSRSDS